MLHGEPAGDDARGRQRDRIAVAVVDFEAALGQRDVEVGVEPGEDLPAAFEIDAPAPRRIAGAHAALVAVPGQLALEIELPEGEREVDLVLEEPRTRADLEASRAGQRARGGSLHRAA